MSLLGGSKNSNVDKFKNYLIEGEVIEAVYKLMLDQICFTNKRIIFIDKEILSTKKSIVNLPYKAIHYFSVKKGGVLELDNEITLYTKGANFEIEFAKGTDILEVEKLLTQYIC